MDSLLLALSTRTDLFPPLNRGEVLHLVRMISCIQVAVSGPAALGSGSRKREGTSALEVAELRAKMQNQECKMDPMLCCWLKCAKSILLDF